VTDVLSEISIVCFEGFCLSYLGTKTTRVGYAVRRSEAKIIVYVGIESSTLSVLMAQLNLKCSL